MGGGGEYEDLAAYALSRYGEEYDRAAPDCPYDTSMGGEQASLQRMTWFVYEWKSPRTGATVLEEFVAERVHDGERAAALLRRGEVVRDTFVVEPGDEEGTIRAWAAGTGKTYVMAVPEPAERYVPTTVFEGRIHPREGDVYAACGALTQPPRDVDIRVSARYLAVRAAEAAGRRRRGKRVSPEDVDGMAESLESILSADPSDPTGGMDPRTARRVSDSIRSEAAAWEAATFARVPAGAGIESFLRGYPMALLDNICNELDVDCPESREDMVAGVMGELRGLVCTLVSEMSEGEKDALAHLMRRGDMPMRTAMAELGGMVGEEGRDGDIDGPDGPGDGLAFVQMFTLWGLVAVGTRVLDGRRQKMATVAPDVREWIMGCPGWAQRVGEGT